MSLLVAALTTEIFVPYFLQVVHQQTPLAAGYMTAMMAGGWTVASVYSAGRSALQAHRLIRISPWVVFTAIVALAATMPVTVWNPAWFGTVIYCVALTAVGFGIGLAWPHLLTRVFSAAAPGEENLASSSITTVQLYATALTAALAGVVANAGGLTEPGGVEGARTAALALFGVFALAPALAAVLAGRLAR